MHYREITTIDIPALRSLMDQLGYPLDENTMRENVEKYLELPYQKAWVAEVSGQVVGCLALAITHYFHRPASFSRVIALVVDQNYLRNGIGKGLLELAEKYSIQNGCSHIELTSGMHREKIGSHDFYISLGYSEMNNLKKYFVKKLVQ